MSKHLKVAIAGLALIVFAGAAASNPATAAKAKTKSKPLKFYGDEHFDDSLKFDVRTTGDDADDVADARIVDLYIAAARQTYRNGPGGERKRVYRVKGRISFNFQNDQDWRLVQARCGLKGPVGSSVLSDDRSQRLAFPRPQNALVRKEPSTTLGISAGAFTLTFPFPGQDNYVSETTKPISAWEAPKASRRHAFLWGPADEDAPINTESFGFAAYYAGGPANFTIKMRCDLKGFGDNNEFFAEGGRTISRTSNPPG